MKKVLTTLTLLITLCSFAFGQDDYYFKGEIPMGLGNNCVVTSIIYVDGVLQTTQDIEIAAYLNDELRGRLRGYYHEDTFPEELINNYYRGIVAYRADGESGNMIFKGYNHETKKELETTYTCNIAEETVGGYKVPVEIYFTTVAPVAKVGNTEYSNIDVAIANWTAGSTLTLLDNVTLSDVVTLKSTEHHILDLGTYTMTAASGKNAIEIVAYGTGDAERNAITINADATNPGGINAGNKSVIYYNYANGGITTNDRPIIKINNGVFTGMTSALTSGGIYFKGGSAARQAATLEITGGVFNCSILGQSKSKLRISGGTFNYSVGSQGDSTAIRLIWGGTFKSFGFMTADANNTKFWFGTSMGNSNVGLYINDDDYLVVGGAVITEAGETFAASSANTAWNNSTLLTYSSAATYGLYYTDALHCLNDNNKANGVVNIYTEQLDLTSLNYKGTINISNTLAVTFNEGTTPAWTVANTDGYNVISTDVTENGIVTRTYTIVQGVAQIVETEEYFNSLAEAVEAAEAGQTITLLQSTEGKGIVIDKSLTIDFATFTYTFVEQGVGDTPTKSNGFQILKDNNVTLKNGTLNVHEDYRSNYYILIQNYANLTVEDMELDGTNLDMWSATDQDSYVLSNNSGNVNVTGTTKITANDEGDLAFALDACYNPSYTAPIVTLDENVTVVGKVEVTGGQLYTDVALEAIVRETVAGSTEGWGTISSPTKEGKVVFSTTGSHDFYQYNESDELEWNNIAASIVENTYTMEAGRGYLYANTENTELSFEGKLNNEAINYALSYTATQNLKGFNFIGNPFTHNITFAHLNGTIAEGYYVVGDDGQFNAVEPSTSTDAFIAPLQAFLVQATEAGDLTINKKAISRRDASNGALEIRVSNTNYSDVAYVSFNEGAGLEKIGHQNEDVPLVYVTAENKNYAIVKLNQDATEIPVSFIAKTMGQYTISVKTLDCEFESMYLIDRMTGKETNLLMEDYTFVASTNDNPNRFIITMKPNSNNSTEADRNFIFYNGYELIINNIDGEGVVRVIDATGRLVGEYNVFGSANISTASFARGVYMIQMNNNKEVKTQKVVIR